MPLSAATWESAMLKLTDPSDPDFVGWPASHADAGSNWAAVADTFFADIVMPPAVPPVVPPATPPANTVGYDAFTAAYALSSGLDALSAGLVAYAAAIAASVPTSTPPPLPPSFPSLPNTDDPAAPAASIAAAVYAWAITGLGPTPAALPWS